MQGHGSRVRNCSVFTGQATVPTGNRRTRMTMSKFVCVLIRAHEEVASGNSCDIEPRLAVSRVNKGRDHYLTASEMDLMFASIFSCFF